MYLPPSVGGHHHPAAPMLPMFDGVLAFLRDPKHRMTPMSEGQGVLAGVPLSLGEVRKFAWFGPHFWKRLMAVSPEPHGISWREASLVRARLCCGDVVRRIFRCPPTHSSTPPPPTRHC